MLRFRRKSKVEIQTIPQIKYTRLAHETTIEDDGGLISLYIRPLEQHPDRFVCDSYEIDCLVSHVDINNKGNVQGIEVILKRRPGQEPRY
jgi:hypothetical protein